MRICVVGAGAIGGLMGAKLALAGEEVTVIDQGEHLKAIQKNGLKLIWEDGSEHVAKDIKAMDRITDAGPQDLVILALKAHYLEKIAEEVSALIGPDTMVMTVQNGIPWWYFHNHGGEFDGHRLNTLDPNGVLGRHIDGDRIVGCVVYPAADVPAPGVEMIAEALGDHRLDYLDYEGPVSGDRGLVSRWDRAVTAVEQGQTSPAEVRRVLGFTGPARSK